MMKSSALRRFEKDNTGSAIITVVIVILFVVALGTALLFTAYMGMQVSVSARNEKASFYDASAAMDEVKLSIQDEVSAALNSAYTDTLISYAKLSMKDINGNATANPQDAMYATFVKELVKSGLFSYKASRSLSGVTTVDISVDVEKLLPAITEEGASATLTGEDEAVVADNGDFTIKNLQLSYIDAKGFESRIATDMVIKIPQFFTGSSVSGTVSNYAIIAEKGFVSEGVSAIKNGGIFAGALPADNAHAPNGTSPTIVNSIITKKANDSLSISGGRIVCSGAVHSALKSTIKLEPQTFDIWAQELISEKGSTFVANGNTFVANDLILNSGSKVTLSGQYYGFGSSDADSGKNDANSSSIFVNSYDTDNKNASLTLTGLNQLTLAGVSFVNVKTGTQADTTIATGQSIAAKSDQLAYLIPASAIKNYKTNPCVAQKDENGNYIAPEFNYNSVLWTISGTDKTLADYLGAGNVNAEPLAYFSMDGTGYFFINFKNQAMANTYFKDYFTARPDAIKQYLDLYLDLKDKKSITTIAKGDTYEKYTGSWETILGNSLFPDSQAIYFASMYESLSTSPIGLYVDKEKLDSVTGTKTFKDASNKTVAIITAGNYTYSGGNEKVIVAKGDVSINANFSGVVISCGTVTLNGYTVNYEKPSDTILSSKCDNELLSVYLNATVFGGDTSQRLNEWSPNKLVYYDNWQKN